MEQPTQHGREVWIPGTPRAKGRPRFGKGRTYTPATTAAAEAAIGWEWKRVHGDAAMFDGPLYVEAFFIGGTGDVDNMSKALLDGLQGVAFTNDRQVKQLFAHHLPRSKDLPAGTLVRIEEIAEYPGWALQTVALNRLRAVTSKGGDGNG